MGFASGMGWFVKFCLLGLCNLLLVVSYWFVFAIDCSFRLGGLGRFAVSLGFWDLSFVFIEF